MFREPKSESPRVPSPWDPFLPSPPSGCSVDSLKHIHDGVPKLVPEVEEVRSVVTLCLQTTLLSSG